MKQLIALIFTIISYSSFGQFEIKSICPVKDNSDLEQLDSIFSTKIIIGLGESTHGTSEFTTLRFRIFKYLVENHSFNTFFLESVNTNCNRINNYIKGNKDTLIKVVQELDYFPFRTSEMLEIIEWMKYYNNLNKNQLNFIGIDQKSSFQKKNFRDSCMSQNILTFINNNPDTKGIYFAHNEHISNIHKKTIKRTGAFLYDNLNNQYYSIALLFNKGSFNAKIKDRNEYILTVIKLNKSKPKTIENYISKKNTEFYFSPSESIKIYKIRYSSIGSLYNFHNCSNIKHPYYKYDKHHVDAYLYIENSTPLTILK